MKKNLLYLLILLSGPLAFAQDPPPADPAAASTEWGMNLGLGTEVLDGTLYQSLSLMPDLSFGPLGVGLDLRLHFQFYEVPGGQFGIYPRVKDWYDSSQSVSQNLDKYLSQIAYIRWEKKGAPLFVQLGMIQNGSLGNGFILGGYDNTVLRPEQKYVGLSFDLDGKLFDFPFVGIETFTSNVSSFDVLGGRLFVRPLAKAGLPFLDEMQIGGTLVLDRDPYYWNSNSALKTTAPSEVVQVFGGDVTLPLFKNAIASMKVYGDGAFMANSSGYAAGLAGSLLIDFFSYKLEGRYLGENFVPTYFDQAYDLNRTAKFQTYKRVVGFETPAYAGYLGQIGTNILKEMLVFMVTVEGPFGDVATKDPNDAAKFPKVRGAFKFEQKDIPVSASAFYFKDKIMSLEELVSPDNARIGAEIGYKMGPAVISMVYNLRYLPQDDPLYTSTNRWEITSKLETKIKLK